MKTYQVNDEGFYGNFGGAYIPEILYQCVEQLKDNYRKVLDSDDFRQEFHSLLRDYVGRPSPLYLAKRLSERYGCRIYLKREDLNHTGAHKINNAIGQVLLARRMGKKRIIAETGAGQHAPAMCSGRRNQLQRDGHLGANWHHIHVHEPRADAHPPQTLHP